MAKDKTRVAVLGGGVGSLSALAGIVTAPDYKPEEWELIVYQEGWRLGGKGASGRNKEISERIEEHGLHIWLGFYDNAFHLIKAAYESMGENYKDFFSPTNLLVFQEHIQGKWEPWLLDFPTNDEEPGTPNEVLKPISYAKMLVEMLITWITGQPDSDDLDKLVKEGGKDWLDEIDLFDWIEDRIEDALEGGISGILKLIQKLLEKAEDSFEIVALAILEAVSLITRGLLSLVGRALDVDLNEHQDLRRFWTLADLSLTIVIGMIQDKVFRDGFSAIDDLDFRAWLTKNGASHWATENPLVQAIYDLIFAYEKGSLEKPTVSAGVALYGAMRMLFTYKGSIFWKMDMGMGDTIFTPFQELLKAKGVKFKYFHKVTKLVHEAGSDEISAIEMQEQVSLKAGVEEYDPYVMVEDWPCWPSTPNWDQLDPADVPELKALQERHLSLESAWSPWKGVKNFSLKKGEDFDLVLCGISKRPLVEISSDLMVIPAFRAMMENVQTVTTQAGQLWFKKSVNELGYNPGDPDYDHIDAINGGFQEPYGTVADLTHLIHKELWPADNTPKYLPYFCGPLPMENPPVPFTDEGYPQRVYDQVKKEGVAWVNKNGPDLWPKAAKQGQGIAPSEFVSQYWRAGQNLTEHYVLSIPGTTKYRIGPNDLGIKNLFVAGDWTQNIINAGCVEAGTISGLNCAKALTGWDIPIFGVEEGEL